MQRFSKIGLLVCAAAFALPSPGQAEEEDISTYLAGRWGDANGDWEDQPEDWIYAPCRKGHPRADSAYVFSGDLAHLQVQSNGHQGADTWQEPVISPVALDKPIDPAQIRTRKGYENTSFVTLIVFERRGMIVPKELFAGMIVILGEDRMVLVSDTADGAGLVEQNLVRCKDR
ncbi:MAG TPA: hypothetical protein VL094_00770 [Sphingomonadaceae bacterium]|nr:hypothetical protein [Sphingomonadaceae bacterium]